jgi:hypothetical protein
MRSAGGRLSVLTTSVISNLMTWFCTNVIKKFRNGNVNLVAHCLLFLEKLWEITKNFRVCENEPSTFDIKVGLS